MSRSGQEMGRKVSAWLNFYRSGFFFAEKLEVKSAAVKNRVPCIEKLAPGWILRQNSTL
jgi:hypothetical protein